MSGRRIAAIGFVLVVIFIIVAGIAAWVLWTREAPQVPKLASAATPIAPAPELPAPVVARRVKKAPEPYLPPYEKQPPVLFGLMHPEQAKVEPHWPTLYGRVVSSSDQAPLRDAVIGVPNEFDSGRERHESVLMLDDVRVVARTDGEGRFQIEESVVGSALTASSAGFGALLFDRDWLGRSRDAAFVVPLAPAARFMARVTDRAGAPKAGVEIRLLASSYEATPRKDLPVDRILMLLVGGRHITDEQGDANFAGMPSGVPFDAELWIDHVRILRDPAPFVFEPGKETSKVWQMGTGCTVTGRLIDDRERPVDGQALWLTQRGLFLRPTVHRASFYESDEEKVSQFIATDREGRFSIPDVGPGRWWIGIPPPKPRFGRSQPIDVEAIAPVAEAFDVGPRQTPVELVLRVHRGLYIRGKMVDPEGRPVLGFIFAQSKSDDLHFTAGESTDGDSGEFSLGPLEPGEYHLDAEPSPFNELEKSRERMGTPLAPNASITVAAGCEDVVIEVGRGGSIRCKATRADTGVDVDASFCLTNAKNMEQAIYIGLFDAAPTASFSSLSPGTYVISAVTHDGRVGCVRDILLGEGQRIDDVNVRVEPGAHLKLNYVGTDSEYAQVTIYAGATVYGGDGIHAGTSSTLVAPAGRVTVRWNAGSDRFDEEVQLSVGETRELAWPRPK